jgi:NAD(P)-dependent dehydrogenase (short-subunit alcohol dehydrogenase family)
VNVKVMGYLRCIREVAPHMRARGGGRIVNISGLASRSTGSTIGSIRNVAVAALAKNLAGRRPALRAGAGRLRGRGRAAHGPGQRAGPARRRAREVADMIAFLASPRAVAINGDAIA